MKAVESRVRSRSFGDVRDRRELPSGGSDGQVIREIGTAQTLLTPAQIEELVERHRGGEGVVALATSYGVHRSTVTAHLDRRGARRRLGLADEQVQRASRLYLRGFTLDEIAAELSTSQRTVGRAVASLGVARPDRARSVPRNETFGGLSSLNIAGCCGTFRVVSECYGVGRIGR